MGRRARGRGIANAAVRAAERLERATALSRDEEAAAIARRVYGVARDLRPDAQFPLRVQAPVQTAAELAGLAIVRTYALAVPGSPEEAELAFDVAAYLTSGFFSMISDFEVDHFRSWRARMEAGDGGDAAGDGSSRESAPDADPALGREEAPEIG